MPEYMIRYVQHELIWIVVEAENEKEAREKFEKGDVEWSEGRGYGDYLDNTFEAIVKLDENGDPIGDI